MAGKVTLTVRGGHRFAFSLPVDSPLLPRFKGMADKQGANPGWHDDELIQIPLDDGRECLSVHLSDITITDLQLPNRGEHPLMNISEGHLGGYISARHPRSVEMGMEHGDSATWSPELWRWLVQRLGISSVLDVGCGEGHAAGFFAGLGCRVSGVDGSALALRDTVIPGRHVLHDFTTGPYVPEAQYDLVWSCEFVEHVEERYVENFLAAFDAAGKFVFMTAAPPGQPGWHHVNCQLSEYWIEKLERRGFFYSEALTHRARALAAKGHFSHQGLAFARQADPAVP